MSRHGYIQSFWLRKQKPGGWLGCGWCSIFKKDMRVSTEQGRPIFSVPTKSTSCDPRAHHCVDLITDSNSDIWLMCILWALFFLVSSRVSGHVPCDFFPGLSYLAFRNRDSTPENSHSFSNLDCGRSAPLLGSVFAQFSLDSRAFEKSTTSAFSGNAEMLTNTWELGSFVRYAINGYKWPGQRARSVTSRCQVSSWRPTAVAVVWRSVGLIYRWADSLHF